MKLYDQIETWLDARQKITVHRQLLVIEGPEHWAIEQANIVLGELSTTLWIGDNSHQHKKKVTGQYRQFLGQEFDNVVINAYSGFRANTAVALSGVIRAKGLMILLCPMLPDWPNFPDPEKHNRMSYGYTSDSSLFIKILVKKLLNDPHVAILGPKEFKGSITPLLDTLQTFQFKMDSNSEQMQAVDGILKVATGHRNRPLVLSADRGRGKSSALGIAAAKLITEHSKKILLTAPSPNTVEQVFAHANSNLQYAKKSKNHIETHSGSLTFCAADEVLSKELNADILFIDEAAALPTQLLMQLIDKFSRIVFSTTLHGYEGSGRGFELRIKDYLTHHKPQWKTLHLHQPIRWFAGDYLEKFWFEALFMDKLPSQTQPLGLSPIVFSRISRNDLTHDLRESHAIFQLLVNAHYQTSPDDLVRLFDSPEQQCFIAKQGGIIIGVALIIEEGGTKLTELSRAIAEGKRRVKGHLVAQNIAFHHDNPEFCLLKQWRITRIAVTPELQRKGIGQQFVHYIAEASQSDKISCLTSSFGINLVLNDFWQKAGFSIVNLSQNPEISSAEHSAQFIKPMNSLAHSLLSGLRAEFYSELLYQADKSLRKMSPILLAKIMLQFKDLQVEEMANLRSINQFCEGTRPLSICKRLLKTYFIQQTQNASQLEQVQLSLLIALLIQNQEYTDLCRLFSLTGKKQIEIEVRRAMANIINMSKSTLNF